MSELMTKSEGPDWTRLTSGYRVFYDPRNLLDRLHTGDDDEGCWAEIWNELHHQGDVGTASYTVVPALVEIYTTRPRRWELYSYVALLEQCREDRKNPELPDWLQDDYEAALGCLMNHALADLKSASGAGRLLTIFAFVAIRRGAHGLSVALQNFDFNEFAMEDLAKYGDSLNDL